MEHKFWHERWQQNQIGFHHDEINPHLINYWSQLALPAESRVLVPLCGKSNDLLWLLDQGYQVVGVELSPIAVEAFFIENKLPINTRQQDSFAISEINGLQIFCGDFFSLQSSNLGKIDAVYDRAALIALPETMRLDYVNKMASLLTKDTKLLLITLNYLQHEMTGPPFSVSSAEVTRLYQSRCDVQLLADNDALAQEPHLKSRGLSQLQEHIYRLTVK